MARDDEPMAERQPVLITLGMENPNGAEALFLIDGAEPGEIEGFTRAASCCSTAATRRRWPRRAGSWSGFKAAGAAVSYWRQGETGGWRKEA